jgi:TRAP-type C4-dicarboxylate transport system substrate-binding protein
VKQYFKHLGLLGVTAAAAIAVSGAADAVTIKGKDITLRIGSGHPPFITYVKHMGKTFAPNVVRRVAAETSYKIKFKEHYTGTVVNVFDTLEGVQDGRLDVGGWCVCFDDDKALALNLTYYVPFHHPNAIVNREIFKSLIAKHPDIKKDLSGRYNQTVIGVTGFNNYGLLTAFQWSKFSDLKNRKILAAGPNLPWVVAGIPVRTTIPKAPQQMQTGVGEGIILFPDTDYKLKLHEASRGGQYTLTDFGAVVQIMLTINNRTRKRLPPEVLKIIDEEGIVYGKTASKASFDDHEWGIKKLKEAGIKIVKIAPAAKKAWAQKLANWPQQRANAVKAKKKVNMAAMMNDFIAMTKAKGHSFPIDYKIK